MAKNGSNPEEEWLKRLPHTARLYYLVSTYFQAEMPRLYDFLHSDAGDFRGFTITSGNRGGYLLILKRWGDEGREEILFSSEDSPLGCLIFAEDALSRGSWREDKKKT